MFLPREIVSTLRCLSIRQLPLTSHLPILRLYSTETARKPLQFYISPSFHAKPPTASSPTNFQKKSTNNKVMQGFGKDSPIAKFRDLALKGNSQGIGHDFYFIKESNREGDFTIGIADGVGGWEDSGVDPSHFSQALMYYSSLAASERELKDFTPLNIMEKGFEGVSNEKDVTAGSSTVCIATLDSITGQLRASNLGDSTFYLIRNDKVIHSQKSQTHYFNAPFQLEKLPTGPRGDKFLPPDLPKDSDYFQYDLEVGDLFILATDGFSDNVWVQELNQIITLVKNDSKSLTPQDLITKISSTCVNYARICSFKEDKVSPFEYEAKNHKYELRGGKVDDVTVIAVLVGEKCEGKGAEEGGIEVVKV